MDTGEFVNAAGADPSADVVIVGGGGVGSAVAYFLTCLADASLKVVVCERDPSYARAATCLAAGGIRQHFSTPENVRMSQIGFDFLKSAGQTLELNGVAPEMGLKAHPYLRLEAERDIATVREQVAMQLRMGASPLILDRAALAARYPWMNVEDVGIAVLGGAYEGIDLAGTLSNAQVEDLHTAIADHQVIFFRDQRLDPDSLRRLGRHFGELQAHALKGMEGYPEVRRLHADENSKHVSGEEWHTDMSCIPVPPMGSILYIHTLPPIGGDTVFASMYAAYDALSEGMKTYLEGLSAVHDGKLAFGRFDASGTYPIATHKVIRIHPVTKRKLIYVNRGFTSHIEGVPKDESDAILAFLYKHCENAYFQVRFSWRQHSVAFWDNRCTQHLAVWDYFPQTRSGYRVQIEGVPEAA